MRVMQQAMQNRRQAAYRCICPKCQKKGRKLGKKRFTPRCTPTATDTIIGSQAEVVEAIAPPAQGKVKMHGVIWQARSDQSHESGAHVTVIGLEGNLLTVVSMDL
jgi:membrane protein implicated in regulation of membrane protease activity